jgi:2-octaprenylphenol hydroxylase
MREDAEVLVVGDGPVAATAALLALRGGRRVLWLGGKGGDEARADPRLYALAPSSLALLRRLAAWEGVPADEVQPYETMHVLWTEGGSLAFAPPPRSGMILGAMVPAAALRRGLERALASAGERLHRRARSPLVAYTVKEGVACLRTEDGGEFRARVVLDCAGRESALAALAGLPHRIYDPRERALVGVARPALPHDGIARQVFTREGPLGLLPRADGALGYVWSLAAARAEALLRVGAEELERRLSEASEFLLGTLTPEGPAATFPLLIQRRPRLVAPRLLLLGDAARSVHPFAGQGLNLGFGDLSALERVWRGAADPGAWPLLRRYARRRAPESAGTAIGLEALRAFLTRPDPWGVRALSLRLLDRMEPAKGLFVRLATGPADSVLPTPP